MLKGLYTAHTGLRNEQNRMDIMTNNLANASTVGYKKEGSTSQSFGDVLAVKVKDASVGLAIRQPLGINNPGVKIGENYTDYTQGSFRITDNTYDLAISGEGFFAIEFTNKAGETSTKYTRAGDFTLNKDGYLVTNEGDYVLDVNSRRIKINPLSDAAIKKDGSIEQNGVKVAQIGLVDFADYDYLEKYGETYYQPVEGAEIIASNADITRQYESNQKIVQTYDSSLEIAVNQLGRVK